MPPATDNKKRFDFTQPLEATSGEHFFDEKKKKLEQVLSQKKQSGQQGLIVFLSLLSLLLGAGLVYLGYQLYTKSSVSAPSQTPVSNKKAIEKTKIISGEGLSFVLDQFPDQCFKKEIKPVEFIYLDKKTGFETSFICFAPKDGKDVISGVKVATVEFDNRYSIEEFSQKVLAKLGENYIISTEKTILPRDFISYRISNKNAADNTSYYPVVSETNYYLIQVVNQAKGYPDLKDRAKFVDALLGSIYLN